MRTLIAASTAGVALMLASCASDTYGYASACERDARTREAAGTAVGAGIGALAGSGIAGRGNRTGGAVIGGIAGAVAGNLATRGRPGECYYDDGGRPYYFDSRGQQHYWRR